MTSGFWAGRDGKCVGRNRLAHQNSASEKREWYQRSAFYAYVLNCAGGHTEVH